MVACTTERYREDSSLLQITLVAAATPSIGFCVGRLGSSSVYSETTFIGLLKSSPWSFKETIWKKNIQFTHEITHKPTLPDRNKLDILYVCTHMCMNIYGYTYMYVYIHIDTKKLVLKQFSIVLKISFLTLGNTTIQHRCY